MSRPVLTALLLLGCGGRSADTTMDPAADAASAQDSVREDTPPPPPPGLVRWLVGNPGDTITTSSRGLLLMGGGTDVDAAFVWQRDRIHGGDVVVLRASGADGYNDYLFAEIGGVDSVETLIVDTRERASEPYVRWTLDHAEAIFIAGGDQSVYLAAWLNGPVETALQAAWQRGAVVGGTSAGCAVLGSIVYSAAQGTVYSDEALADPYDPRMTFERDFVAYPPLAGVVTDTHFAARDRMGRLLGFVARAVTDGWTAAPIGLGVDENTALVIDGGGAGTVVGSGTVYMVAPRAAPMQCTAGSPLRWDDVRYYKLRAGDTVVLPAGTTTTPPATVTARNGTLTPQDPY